MRLLTLDIQSVGIVIATIKTSSYETRAQAKQ
jgi:hypothetical protein